MKSIGSQSLRPFLSALIEPALNCWISFLECGHWNEEWNENKWDPLVILIAEQEDQFPVDFSSVCVSIISLLARQPSEWLLQSGKWNHNQLIKQATSPHQRKCHRNWIRLLHYHNLAFSPLQSKFRRQLINSSKRRGGRGGRRRRWWWWKIEDKKIIRFYKASRRWRDLSNEKLSAQSVTRSVG